MRAAHTLLPLQKCSYRSSTGNREGSVLFYLKLEVDGEAVDTPYTYIRYDQRYTSWLRKVDSNNSLPNYGVPGQLVTLEGRFFTQDYGNLNIGEEEFGIYHEHFHLIILIFSDI